MAKSQRRDLTTGPIGPILYKLTAPMVLGILSMVLFNIIDTYFVSQLGVNELTALGFTFPPILLLFSLVQGVGVGATALISKSISTGNLNKAARETTDALILGIILAGGFSAVGFVFLEPLFKLLGASEEVMPLIVDYMSIWLLAITFVVVPFVGNSAIRATGDSRTPALIMLFAVVVNAVLDPLLIWGYGPFPELGIRGAAIATAISRAFTLILSLWVLYKREKLLTFSIPSWQTLKGCWGAIMRIGLPAGAARMIVPISNNVITGILARIGGTAVAGYAVGTRVEALGGTILFALAATMGPFAGQNFGKRHFDRILAANNKSNMFAIAWGIFMAGLMFIFGEDISRAFSEGPEIAEVAFLYLTIVPITLGFQGTVSIVNTTLNTLNRPGLASLIVAVQMFVFYLPLAFLGARTSGTQGVFVAIAFSYFLGGMISMFVNKRVLVAMDKRERESKTVESEDAWEKGSS
ncbi:MAG TPA: MATE family efflux transporter [Cytophagales bacterium]|nr:MATE family efflux transporter [Cytophagales bacterium]HAA18213.1 MATE family efflux transporter [Cytophagales bacterium]